MKRRLLGILVIFTLLAIMLFPMATPVMAGAVGGAVEVHNYGPSTEPIHPNNIYLVGMNIFYYPMNVVNLHQSLNWNGNIYVLEPDGDNVTLDTDVILPNRYDEWNYSGPGGVEYYTYTIKSTDPFNVIAPAPGFPTKVLTSHLMAQGFNGIGTGEIADGDWTVPVYVATPDIKVTKTVSPTTTLLGGTVTYTIKIENTGDYPITKYSVNDSIMGNLSASFGDLDPGENETHTFPWTINSIPQNNILHNVVTANYYATGFDRSIGTANTVTGATVTDTAAADVTLLAPATILNINATPSSLPAGGGTVDLTITESNTGTVDLTGVLIDVFQGASLLTTLSYAPDQYLAGNTDSTLNAGDVWLWNVYNVPVTQDVTFYAEGHGYYGTPPIDVEEYADDYVNVMSEPPPVPASSGLVSGLLVVGLGGLMAIFMYRKTQKAHQR